MAVLGNLVVNMTLNTAALTAGFGEAAQIATAGAKNVGRILDQFGTPVLAAARNARDLGVSAGEIETGMERAARGIGRAHGFLSAINPEFGASALQIHSVVRVASTLTSGFGALALGAAGVAAVVGGLLYRSFGGVF